MGMPTRTGPWPGRPVIDISPPMPWAIWSTPGRVASGPVWPKPEMRAIDDARIDLGDGLVIDLEAVLHVGAVVLDDDVGLLGELHEDRVAFRRS